MKNTLKFVLIIIGLGFITYGFYNFLILEIAATEIQRQLYAMIGVGTLFLIAGFSLGKR